MRAVTPPAVLAAVVFLHICARDGRWVAAQYDSRFESSLNWPLCGFNTESTTAPTNAEEGHYLVNEGTTAFADGWTPIDGCPASRRGASSAADAPVRSAFGPRPLYSDNSRYDFHRGIDLASPVGTPMFALTEGTVIHAGEHSSYDDPVIIVRHIRPGATSCSSGEGCYHAMYLHARAMSVGNGCCAVAEDDTVVAGQLLGWTGVSLSGFAHLHFEIRDTTVDDPFSYWQRDAINPLGSLPYSNAAGVSATVEPGGAPAGSSVVPWTVTVTTARHDVMGVRLDVMDQSTGTIVVQPGNTENAEGYLVYPTSFMFDEWNRQYTHKDSDSVTWASFGEGGERECPFHAAHGNSYDAHVHLDSATESDASVGEFNGIRVVLESHEYYAAGDYYIRVTFTNVQLPDGAGGLEGVGSARATVYLGSSDPVTTTWSLPSPTAAPTNTAAPTPAPTTTTAAPTPAPTTTTAAPTPAPTTTIAAPTPAPTIATAAPTPAPTTITAAPTPAPTTATAAPTAATAAPTPVPTTTTAASATTTVAPTPAPTTTAAAPTPAPTTTPATPTPASTTTTLVPTPAPTTTTTPAPTTTIASVSNPSLTSTTAAPTPALTTTTIPPTPAPTTTSTTTTPAPTPPTTSITTSSNAPTPAPTPTSTTSPSSMPSPATPPKIQTDSPTTPVPTVSASSPGGAPEVKAMAALIPDAAGRVSSSTITPWPAYQRYCTDIGGHDPNVTSCAMSCTPFLQLEGVVVGGSGDEGEAAADELEYHWYSDLDSSDGTGGGCVQFLDSLDGDAVDCLPISPGESFPAATGSSLCYGRVTRPSAASSFPNVTVLVRGGAVETPDCRVYLVLDDLANGLLSGNGESENSLSGTGTLELRAESGFGGTEEAPALGDYHVSGSQDTSITDSFTVISSGYTYHLVQWDGATESPTTGSPLPFGSVEQTVLPYDCLEVAATGTAACAIVYGDGSAGIAAEDGAFVATPAEPSADAFSGERGTVACSFAYSLTSGYGVCQPAKLQVRAVQHNPCPALDDSCHQVASASFDIACDDRTPSGLAPALGGPAEDGVSTAVCPAGRTPARCHAVTANPSAAQPDVAFTRFVERDGVTVCEAAQTDTADMRALALCTDEELVTVTSSLGAGEGEVSASCKDGGKVYGCAAWCSEDNTCLFGRQTEAECVYTSTGEIEVQVRCAPVREAPPPTILGNAAVSELEESAQVVVVFTTIKFRSTASGSFAAELRSAASETLAAAAGVPEGRVILLPMKDDAESGGDVTLNVLVVFHAETESEREAAFIVQLTTSASSIFEGDLAFNDYEILDQATVTRSQTTYGKYQLWPAVIEATKDAESGCRALRATTVLLVLTCFGALVM